MIHSFDAKNLFSWEVLHFDFTSGVTSIEGFNFDDGTPEGSGKSSIPNGICWTLFGMIPKDAKIDDVIREGAESCEGVVTLADGWKIVRTRKPNELYMLSPKGKVEKGLDAKETQAKINQKLGMGFDTFCQAVYFSQNFPDKFVTATDKKKGEILSEIQDLEQFSKAKKATAKLITTEEAQLEGLKKDLQKAQEIGQHLFQEEARWKALMQKFLSDKAAQLETKQAALESNRKRLETLQAEIEGNSLEEIETVRTEVQEAIAKAEADLNAAKFSLKDAKRAQEQYAAVIADFERKSRNIAIQEDSLKRLLEEPITEVSAEEMAQVIADVKALSDAAAEIKAQLLAVKGRASQKAQLERKRDAKYREYDEQKAKIEAFSASKAKLCPTCGAEMGKKHVEEHLLEMQTVLSKLNAECVELNQNIAEIGETDATALQEQYREAEEAWLAVAAHRDELQHAQMQVKANKEKRVMLEDLVQGLKKEAVVLENRALQLEVKDVSPIEHEIEELNRSLSDYRADLTRLNGETAKVRAATTEINGLTSKIEFAEKEIAEIEAKDGHIYEASIEECSQKLSANKEAITSVEGLIQEKILRIGRLETLKDGFGEVKSFVFRGLLKDLSKKANRYLSELFEVPVTIKFSNEGEDGEVSKISVSVNLDGSDRPLGLYSGGQARRIQLAVDLALSEIIASRASKAINLRIFDEPFKDLSEVSMEKAVKLFETLKGSTILIEHNSIVKSIVNNYFRVELRDGVSRQAE